MSIFKKLFGSNEPAENKSGDQPDNSRLTDLLEAYAKEPGDKTYKNVMLELMNGTSFLLLPSVNETEGNEAWRKTEKDEELKLTCIFNLDGLKVLGAFTDEQALADWAQTETSYTAMPAKSVLELCVNNGIDRIVINSNQPTMFVLERSRENLEPRKMEEGTEVLLGTPMNPLSKHTIEKLIENFRKVDSVQEAFQYLQGVKGESQPTLVIGIKLSPDSENARTAAFNAVQDALSVEKVHESVDIFIIGSDDLYQTVSRIQDALFYRK